MLGYAFYTTFLYKYICRYVRVWKLLIFSNMCACKYWLLTTFFYFLHSIRIWKLPIDEWRNQKSSCMTWTVPLKTILKSYGLLFQDASQTSLPLPVYLYIHKYIHTWFLFSHITQVRGTFWSTYSHSIFHP